MDSLIESMNVAAGMPWEAFAAGLVCGAVLITVTHWHERFRKRHG